MASKKQAAPVGKKVGKIGKGQPRGLSKQVATLFRSAFAKLRTVLLRAKRARSCKSKSSGAKSTKSLTKKEVRLVDKLARKAAVAHLWKQRRTRSAKKRRAKKQQKYIRKLRFLKNHRLIALRASLKKSRFRKKKFLKFRRSCAKSTARVFKKKAKHCLPMSAAKLLLVKQKRSLMNRRSRRQRFSKTRTSASKILDLQRFSFTQRLRRVGLKVLRARLFQIYLDRKPGFARKVALLRRKGALQALRGKQMRISGKRMLADSVSKLFALQGRLFHERGKQLAGSVNYAGLVGTGTTSKIDSGEERKVLRRAGQLVRAGKRFATQGKRLQKLASAHTASLRQHLAAGTVLTYTKDCTQKLALLDCANDFLEIRKKREQLKTFLARRCRLALEKAKRTFVDAPAAKMAKTSAIRSKAVAKKITADGRKVYSYPKTGSPHPWSHNVVSSPHE